MLEDYPVVETIHVRWSDMDAMGHVNNARFFTYFESSRIRYFESVKIWDAGEERHAPALVHAECDFKAQLHFPAIVEVGAKAVRIGNKSIEFEHVIAHKDTVDVVATGKSIIAWIDYNSGKSIPLPDALRQTIEQFEGRG